MPSVNGDKILEVFFSYSHRDETLCNELNAHLSALKRQSVIKNWTDRQITAGNDWRDEIEKHLDSADLILLLVSADFLNSDFCYLIETSRALLRHESGDARVIPVIVRPVDWQGLPISKLQALPKDSKPVTSWENHDEAWTNVAQGIRKAIEEMAGRKAQRLRESGLLPADIPRPPRVGFVPRRGQDGRDLIERLCEELAPEWRQIVTLWGAGGAGKTALAAESARAMSNQFRGRIIWTNPQLRADFTAAALLDEIATQLGRADLRTTPPADMPELVYAILSQLPTLIVLDSFETISKESQPQIIEWLIGAPCSVLITTRDRIDHMCSVPVAAMLRGEACDFLSRLIDGAHDRASFDRLDRDLIIETAERNPLVMQWIVGQIDEAQRPSDVLAELRQGEGAAALRVFDRSFHLEQLGDDGRAALLALSLFTPSASREALAQVAGFGDDLKRLNEAVRRLARLWMVTAKDGGERLAIEGLTREMARARIARLPNGDGFKQRFVSHFLAYAESHDQPKPEDYDALEAERENLLCAMDIAFEAQDWRTVIHFMDAILSSGQWLHVRGYWDEAKERGEQTLTAARKLQDQESIARHAHNLANIHQAQGDLDAARSLCQQSLDIKQKLDDQSGIARSLHQLGILAQAQRDFDKAQSFYQRCLDISRDLGDDNGIASALYELGRLAQSKGDLNDTRSLYQQSLDIDQKLGNQRCIANTLGQLGILAQTQGDLDKARSLYQQSLDINRKLGDHSGIAKSLHQLGPLAQAQGDLDEARSLYQQSLDINRKFGNQNGIAITLGQLGRLAEDGGDKVEAARLFREALTIFERLKSPYADIARESLARVERQDEA